MIIRSLLLIKINYRRSKGFLEQKITGISYNILNLPSVITVAGKGAIKYYYDAVGNKLQKRTTDNTASPNTTVITYIGGAVYQNDTLQFFGTPEGRVRANTAKTFWIYDYFLKDHLGNSRMMITDDYNVSSPILEAYSYYPFGLQQKGIGLEHTARSVQNKYTYNGKELQKDLGLDQYDYGARFYDAQIGRFQSQDSYAAKYLPLTPYQYAANNPVQNIDINGDSIWVSVTTTDANGNSVTNRYYWQHDQGYEGWHDASGNHVSSQNDFMKNVNGALATLNLTKEGSTILNDLTSSADAFNIENSKDNKFSESNNIKGHANEIKTDPQWSQLLSTLSSSQLNGGSGGTVKWNPSGASVWVLGKNGKVVQQNNPITNLGHELGHAYDANNGLLDDRMEQGLNRNEWQASYRENIIRKQLGQPTRTNYRSYQDANTGVLTPAPPRITNATNEPIKPAWLSK